MVLCPFIVYLLDCSFKVELFVITLIPRVAGVLGTYQMWPNLVSVAVQLRLHHVHLFCPKLTRVVMLHIHMSTVSQTSYNMWCLINIIILQVELDALSPEKALGVKDVVEAWHAMLHM